MTTFDPETRDALRLLARARTPDAAVIERAWSAMQVRLVEGPAPMDLGLDDPRPAGMRPVVLAIAAAAVVALALGAAVAGDRATLDEGRDAGLTPYGQEQPATEQLSSPQPAQDTPAPSTAEHLPAAASDELEAPTPTKPIAMPRAQRRSKASALADQSPTSTSSDLEAELRLLARANAAMREGRNADALAVLDQHAREFPRGQLAPERDYKRARVTCELGHREAARKLAQLFVRTYPSSPMRAKVGEICREPTE